MLKIKDNVDLKELEKFGFVYCDGSNKYLFTNKILRCYGQEWVVEWYEEEGNPFLVVTSNREILSFNQGEELYDCVIESETLLEPIYELIEAGLVENVVRDE